METLLNSQKEIFLRNKQALMAAKQAGVKLLSAQVDLWQPLVLT